MFRAVFVLSLMLLSTILPVMATGAGQLSLAADYWPPFTSDDKGKRIAADLVETALRNSGINPKTQILPWQEVLSGVQSGKFDAVIGAWRSPQREEFLIFSRPYLENRIKLIGLTTSKLTDFNDIQQLKGYKIAVVKGYAYGDDLAKDNDITKVEGASVGDNLRKLLKGDVDYMLADSIVAQALQDYLKPEVKNKLHIYKKAVAIRNLHFAVRRSYPGAQALVEKFNQAVDKMIADGTYNQILGLKWILADTNADGIYEYIAGQNTHAADGDPLSADSGYLLFSTDELTGKNKKSRIRYRVYDEEYDSWKDASQAIQGVERRESEQDIRELKGGVEFLFGEF